MTSQPVTWRDNGVSIIFNAKKTDKKPLPLGPEELDDTMNWYQRCTLC